MKPAEKLMKYSLGVCKQFMLIIPSLHDGSGEESPVHLTWTSTMRPTPRHNDPRDRRTEEPAARAALSFGLAPTLTNKLDRSIWV